MDAVGYKAAGVQGVFLVTRLLVMDDEVKSVFVMDECFFTI